MCRAIVGQSRYAVAAVHGAVGAVGEVVLLSWV